jgi:hypothetical protein
MRVMAAVVVRMIDNRGRRLQPGKGEQHQQNQEGPQPAARLPMKAHQRLQPLYTGIPGLRKGIVSENALIRYFRSDNSGDKCALPCGAGHRFSWPAEFEHGTQTTNNDRLRHASSWPDRLQQFPRRETHDGEEDSEADDDHRQLAAAREVSHARLFQEYAQAHPHRLRRAVLDGYIGI